jgi:hypothetical protein
MHEVLGQHLVLCHQLYGTVPLFLVLPNPCLLESKGKVSVNCKELSMARVVKPQNSSARRLGNSLKMERMLAAQPFEASSEVWP